MKTVDRLVALDERVSTRSQRFVRRAVDRLLGRRLAEGLRRLDSRVLDPVDRFMQRHPWSCSIPVGLIFGLGTTLEARGTTRWLMAIGVALFWTISFRLGLRRAAMRSARSSVPASKIPKA